MSISAIRLTLFAFLFQSLTSCITVNVNFPEAAVQQASDSYVEQLYKLKEGADKSKAAPTTSTSQTKKGASHKVISPWQFFIPSAYAVDEFKVQSELITQIQKREVGRLHQMERFKSDGLIGENNKGLLVVRGEPKALQKKRIQDLINEENTDRELLYREVLRINGMSSAQISTIVNNFAQSFQSKSPKGTWIQSSGGQWSRK